jgi:O-antigen ligase
MLSRGLQSSYIYLGVLALAHGYAVFQYGGSTITGWNVCLLLLGLVAVAYWLRTASADLAPPMEPWFGWAVLLVPSYVALQLVPLPLSLLRVLSPTRARIADSLGLVMQPPGFVPLSITPATTFAHLFRIIGYTVIFLLIRDIAWRSLQRRSWAPAIPIIGVVAMEACIGLAQQAGGAEVQGTYANRNHFAGLLEMGLPITVAYGIALFTSDHPRRASPTLLTLMACAVFSLAAAIFVGLTYSLSKMGFVAGLCGLFGMGALAFWTMLEGWKKWLAVAGLAAGCLLVFVWLPPVELIARFGDVASDGGATSEGRWPIWRDTLHLSSAYPLFGCGLGTYLTAFLKYQTTAVDFNFTFAHNDYLELATELGGVGSLLLAGLMLTILVKALRAATSSPSRDSRYLGLGCAGAMVAIGLHSLTDFNLYLPANALLLAWISGIAAGLPSRAAPAPSQQAVPGRVFFRRPAIGLGCLLIVYAPAWILFETAFRSDLQAERRFCRFGICDTDSVLAARTLEKGGNVAAVPPAELLEAIRRDAAAPSRWCDLGEAMLRSGRVQQARDCFSTALALGPDVPPILLRAAKFYHGLQEKQRALEQTSRVLEKTAFYDAFIFDWYSEKKEPVTAILTWGLPGGPRATQAYLGYLMALDNRADAAKVWDWVLSHRYGDDRLAREYVNFLFRAKSYEAAAKTWAQHLGDRRNGYLESNWLLNGDFESEPLELAFDWRMANLKHDVEVARDGSVVHTGSQSLRIRFGGKENVDYGDTVQTAFVTPGIYRFEAFIRTQDITTDQGIGFHIFDPEARSRLDVRTEQVIGTNDWKRIERVIRVPHGTRLLTLQVVRQPTWEFDNRISGTAWIDTVSLRRVDAR